MSQIYSKDVLIYKITEFFTELSKRKITSVILGCTELPIAFQMLPKNIIDQFEVFDPAVFVTDSISKIIKKSKSVDKHRINEVKKTLKKIVSETSATPDSFDALHNKL